MRKLKEFRRPEIVEAALTVASAQGIEGMSMRAVAKQVGVTPMALYGYFRSKEELLDAVTDRLLAEIPPPPIGLGWRETLVHLATGLRAVALRHPAVIPVLLHGPGGGPDAVRIVDTTFQALLEAGVPPADVPRIERLVSSFALGHVLSEANGRFGRTRTWPGPPYSNHPGPNQPDPKSGPDQSGARRPGPPQLSANRPSANQPSGGRLGEDPTAPGLPGHDALGAELLAAPIDWDAEFRADLALICDLVERQASSRSPSVSR